MEEKKILSAEEMLEKIFYYMNCLVSERDFSSAILLLTDLGRTLVNAERASFWYRDVKNKQYWTLAASDTGKIVVLEGTGIVGASIEKNETILINEPYQDERFNPQVDKDTGYVTKSILCMPVINTYGEVIGAYQAINKLGEKESGKFDEQDVKRLALAAGYSGKLLETYLLRLQNQTDQLTGLKNRKGLYDYYENIVLTTLRSQAVSMIMCDIDFFKKVNDQYGHNAGDEVLKMVSGLMKQQVQDSGEVFRWGGEEFIILLPQMNDIQAAEIAEKIRCSIKETECKYEDAIIQVTMSFGVKQLEEKVTPDANIKAADEKLYLAKTSGRDKVVS